MPVLNPVRPIATAEDSAALTALMAEPEAPISDAPVPCPQELALLLLAAAALLAPRMPKEPRK